LLESLTKRILHQIAKETYVIYVTFFDNRGYDWQEYLPQDIVYQTDSSMDVKVAKGGHAMIIVRKSQNIPFEGIKKIFYVKHSTLKYDRYHFSFNIGKSSEKKKKTQLLKTCAHFYIEVYRLHHDNKNLGNYQQDETTTLEDKILEKVYYNNDRHSPTIKRFGLSLIPVTIELKAKNHSSLLQLHLTFGWCTGFDGPVKRTFQS
jgi:hypothetical protein